MGCGAKRLYASRAQARKVAHWSDGGWGGESAHAYYCTTHHGYHTGHLTELRDLERAVKHPVERFMWRDLLASEVA